MKRQSTRKLSFLEFFETLQREYLVAELRYKIYPREKDKIYYKNKEMVGKKENIETISIRNNLPSIFTDRNLYYKYWNELCGGWGLPNFLYRDKSDREYRRTFDIINYFSKGSIVNYLNEEGEVERGTIQSTSTKHQKVYVMNMDTQKVVGIEYNKISREI